MYIRFSTCHVRTHFHTHKTILKQLVSVESVAARRLLIVNVLLNHFSISKSSDKHTQANLNVLVCICFQAHLLYRNLAEQTHNSSCATGKQQFVDL